MPFVRIQTVKGVYVAYIYWQTIPFNQSSQPYIPMEDIIFNLALQCVIKWPIEFQIGEHCVEEFQFEQCNIEGFQLENVFPFCKQKFIFFKSFEINKNLLNQRLFMINS